ncbi:hypothetical protein FSARC_5960 [Fusarium sarcochroum]|uniref:Rhodopsin domain-containing protein n=1 Tax=Fusarium sarcochroum TaxID=1208366 RepID=A0A8H4X8Z3_9HYPO|nr:hypothetical protein FSARC_5960 [Fusarium sarcochroum]
MDSSTSAEDRSSTVIAVVVVCQVLSVFVVALRLWTRGVIIKACGVDDYLAIVSLTTVMWYTNVAGNIATDLIIILLPIPAITRLKLPRRQKWYLFGVFALGTFTVVISFIRIAFLNDSTDFTWVQVKSTLWSMVEITSAIICACLPTLRPFVRHYFPGLDSTLNHSSGGMILSNAESGINSASHRRAEVFRTTSIPKAQGDLERDDSSIIELFNVNSQDGSARSHLESRGDSAKL